MTTSIECCPDVCPEGLAPRTPDGPGGLAVTWIRPRRGWQLLDVRELWRARELIYILASRDVRVRYKQTMLGAAWAILQPAMMMLVFTLFFNRLAGVTSGDIPYPLFAFAGLLPWTFFAAAIALAGNSVVASERLITKVYFPRLCIPFAAVGAAIVDFFVALLLLIPLMIWWGFAVGPGLLVSIAIFGIIVLAALGVGTFLSALNVAYRDVRYVMPFLVQLWMFMSPVIFLQPEAVRDRPAPAHEAGAAKVSGGETAGHGDDVAAQGRRDDVTARARGAMRLALALNPLNALIAGFRASALGKPVDWADVGTASSAVVLALLAGCLYFRKVEDGFADVI